VTLFWSVFGSVDLFILANNYLVAQGLYVFWWKGKSVLKKWLTTEEPNHGTLTPFINRYRYR
jgi:hypothetical protein